MYSGNSQRAVRSSFSCRHSTMPTWNWCGNVNMASAPSSTSAGKPLAPSAGGGGTSTSGRSRPNTTNAPSASIAPSFSSDSTAMASTRPRLCSAADTRRVPNSIANRPIASATYSALSCQGGGASSEARVSRP